MNTLTAQGVKKIPFKDLLVGGCIQVACDPRDHHKVRISATGFGKRLDRKFAVSVAPGGMLIRRTA